MRVPRTKILLIATILVWVAAYAAWTADWAIGAMPYLFERSLRRVITCLFGTICCLCIWMALDRLAGKGWIVRIAAAMLFCSLASLLFSAVNTLVFYIVAPLWGGTNLMDVIQGAMMEAWVFAAWCALYFAITADASARDVQLKFAEARASELRARNQALAQQINPHFLFNALNAVSGLIIDGQPAKAEKVTVALAGLLRRSLESESGEEVTLGQELDAVRRYLGIEEARFEDRFRVIEDVPAELRQLPVPPLILQPLVENAVKHGVARSSRLVTLTITARRTDDAIEIEVIDDAVPDLNSAMPPGVGIGQSSVRERLSLLYGSNANLDCGQREGGGYRALLRLPFEDSSNA